MRAPPKRAKVIDYRFYEDGTSLFTQGFKKGRTLIFIGPRHSGKTYTAYSYVAPDCIRAGMRLVGNVPVIVDKSIKDSNRKHPLGFDENGVPYYTFCETMSETLKVICENWLQDLYTGRFYDEVATSQKRVRASSDTYQTQKDIWILERKLKSMTVACLQLETDVPTELRGFADLIIRKPSAEDAKLNYIDIIQGGRTDWYVGAKGPEKRYAEIEDLGLPVPKTRTFAFGMFKVDIIHRRLWDFLVKQVKLKATSREPVERTQVKAVLEYVESHKDELGTITNVERAYVLREMKDRMAYSWRKLEEITGIPQSTIRSWFDKLDEAESQGLI